MWRKLMCLGVGLALTGAVSAQERREAREEKREEKREERRAMHGKIVRVNPDTQTVVVQSGTGAEVKEVELRVAETTRYWGPDQQAFNDALRYKGFKEGTEVWYNLGPDANSRTISELRFFDPATTTADLRGKIISADPERGIIVVRTGNGPDAKEVEYRIDKTTRYWGPDQQTLSDGLRYQGFKEGTEVWYRVTPGANSQVIGEVRFYDPAKSPVRPRRR